MMLHGQRVFFSDNGVLTDYTRELNDFRTGSFTMALTAAEDYLYVGSDFPFNNQYFQLSAFGVVPSVVGVELWSGEADGWKSAVDILDFTSTGGVAFNKSGHITWKRDRDEPWIREDESTDVTGLITGPLVYRFYWMRFKWSVDFTATLTHIGNKFSNDDELYSLYPDLDNQNMRDQWDRGSPSGTKTSWDEQAFIAADAIITELKSGNIVLSDSQLMDFEMFRTASVHKTAEIIYGGMGRPSQEDRVSAKTSYNESIDFKNFRVDRNKDANLSDAEKATSITFMSR